IQISGLLAAAEAHQRYSDGCAFVRPWLIAPRLKNASGVCCVLQDLAVCATANAIGGHQAGSLRLACLDRVVRLLEPVANEISSAWNAAAIDLFDLLDIRIAQFSTLARHTNERRITYDHIR